MTLYLKKETSTIYKSILISFSPKLKFSACMQVASLQLQVCKRPLTYQQSTMLSTDECSTIPFIVTEIFLAGICTTTIGRYGSHPDQVSWYLSHAYVRDFRLVGTFRRLIIITHWPLNRSRFITKMKQVKLNHAMANHVSRSDEYKQVLWQEIIKKAVKLAEDSVRALSSS